MNIFRETEPTHIKTEDILRNAGDVAYEPLDLEVYKQNLEKRIARWQKQKWEMVKLLIHTNERMEVLEKLRNIEEQNLTLEAPATLQ